MPCDLLAQLTEAFDDHVLLPAIVAEDTVGISDCWPGPDEAAAFKAFCTKHAISSSQS